MQYIESIGVIYVEAFSPNLEDNESRNAVCIYGTALLKNAKT